jgi:hypothetical protein
MEDSLNFLANGRRTQYFSNWKTTSIFWQMEDDFKFLLQEMQKTTSTSLKQS